MCVWVCVHFTGATVQDNHLDMSSYVISHGLILRLSVSKTSLINAAVSSVCDCVRKWCRCLLPQIWEELGPPDLSQCAPPSLPSVIAKVIHRLMQPRRGVLVHSALRMYSYNLTFSTFCHVRSIHFNTF